MENSRRQLGSGLISKIIWAGYQAHKWTQIGFRNLGIQKKRSNEFIGTETNSKTGDMFILYFPTYILEQIYCNKGFEK